MDKDARKLAADRRAVGVIALTAISVIVYSIPSVNATSTSTSYPPIIITKVDPWIPLKGLDGARPCFMDGDDSLDGWAYAWIELYNTTNETLTTTGEIRIEVQAMNSSGIGGTGSSAGSFSPMSLSPRESCLVPTADFVSVRRGVGGGEGPGPTPGADKDGAVVSIDYTIGNNSRYDGVYTFATPGLSDPYGDLAYWQLDIDSGKWVFKDDMADKRNPNKVTLTDITDGVNHSPIIVNLTILEEIRAPSVVQFELSFINSTTMQPINDGTTVGYEIEYKGSPYPEGFGRWAGHTNTGRDIKYAVMNQTGSLDLVVKITSLNRQAIGGSFDWFDNPEEVKFTTVVVPEFGSTVAAILIATSIASVAVLSKYLQWKIK